MTDTPKCQHDWHFLYINKENNLAKFKCDKCGEITEKDPFANISYIEKDWLFNINQKIEETYNRLSNAKYSDDDMSCYTFSLLMKSAIMMRIAICYDGKMPLSEFIDMAVVNYDTSGDANDDLWYAENHTIQDWC